MRLLKLMLTASGKQGVPQRCRQLRFTDIEMVPKKLQILLNEQAKPGSETESRSGSLGLVNEVANSREDAVTQFDAQQPFSA
jgi:hypothetical protein